MRNTVVACFLLFLGWSAAMASAESPTPAEQLVLSDAALIIGHRGSSAAAPENTLPSFVLAVQEGADLVELDYVHTADGIPVVLHDKTLARTTNAEEFFGEDREAAATTLLDLKRLDAGAWFDERFTGLRIPTLREGLRTIQAGGATLIERKAGDAATLVELLDQMRLTDRVVVQAFDWEFLADVHRLQPTIVLGALGDEALTVDQIAAAKRTGAVVVGWKHTDLTPDSIAAAQQAGLRVWAYTINEDDRVRELVAAGLNGVITDSPAEIRKALFESE